MSKTRPPSNAGYTTVVSNRALGLPYFTLVLLASLSLSPTTADFLVSIFTGSRLALGTYAFYIFLGSTLLLAALGYADNNVLSLSFKLFIICLVLSITSLWSPSVVYLSIKLPLVIVMPTVLFLAGSMISVSKNSRYFGFSIVAFGAIILISAWVFGIDQVAGFQDGLEEDFGGRYQSLSRVLAMATICATILAVNHEDRRLRILFWSLSGLFVMQILYSGGRVGLLIIAVAVPILILTMMSGVQMLACLCLCAISFVIFTYLVDLRDLMIALWPGEMPLTIQRVLLGLDDGATSQFEVLERSNLWRLAFELWLENPFVGVGLAGFPVSAGIGDMVGVYPHNIILELASETGMLGLVLFLGFLGYVISIQRTLTFDREDRMLAVGVLAGGLAISSVISDFGLQRELFIGLGMYCGLKPKLNKYHA